MNADVLTTRVADGIAVITLGSARRIYFDAEMGDAPHRSVRRIRGRPQRSRCHRDWWRTRLFYSSLFHRCAYPPRRGPCARPVASGRERDLHGGFLDKAIALCEACQNL